MIKRLFALLLAVSAVLALYACNSEIELEETTTETTELTTMWTEWWSTEEFSTEESTTEPDAIAAQNTYSRIYTPKSTTPSVQKQNTCDHVWIDATCTTPRTCAKCGKTEGNPNKHNYAPATCTSPQKCRNCGATTGSALGHNYDALGRCKRCDPYYVNQKATATHPDPTTKAKESEAAETETAATTAAPESTTTTTTTTTTTAPTTESTTASTTSTTVEPIILD